MGVVLPLIVKIVGAIMMLLAVRGGCAAIGHGRETMKTVKSTLYLGFPVHIPDPKRVLGNLHTWTSRGQFDLGLSVFVGPSMNLHLIIVWPSKTL